MTTVGNGTFSGTLGIGTTTPWGNLSVSTLNSSAPELVVGSTTATNFFISNTGNVGVGTSTPNANFVLNGTIASAGGNIVQVASSTNQNIFLVKNSGNVGIGTSTPDQALTVNGNINVAAGKCFMVNDVCIGYTVKLAAIYSTSTPSTATVNDQIKMNGTAGAAPSFSAGVISLPSNTSYFVAEMWGGGGGGGGSGTGAGGTPGTGGNSTIGSAVATSTSTGGSPGTSSTGTAVAKTGGTGGAGTPISSPNSNLGIQGQAGGNIALTGKLFPVSAVVHLEAAPAERPSQPLRQEPMVRRRAAAAPAAAKPQWAMKVRAAAAADILKHFLPVRQERTLLQSVPVVRVERSGPAVARVARAVRVQWL